jgi:rhodanese-related sulfurtransferase
MLTAGNLLGGGAPTEEVIITEDTYASIPRVSLADARAALESGSAVFLDVRDVDSYAQGHIQGAISMPLDELPERMNELDPSAWIITYCT